MVHQVGCQGVSQEDPTDIFKLTFVYRLQPKNIRVNCVAPGPMDTPFFYGQETEDAVAFHKSQSLTGRLTDIKDIAPLVEFLCKDKWITGQIIFCKSTYGITKSFVTDTSVPQQMEVTRLADHQIR